MGGRDNIFKLFGIEDVYSSEMALSMTMLSSLGGGNINNLSQNNNTIMSLQVSSSMFGNTSDSQTFSITNQKSITKY